MSFVRTVLGDIDPSELGVTYAHEHLIIDGGRPVQMVPDFDLGDVDAMAVEVSAAVRLGLRSVVDAMPCDAGRSADKLAELARRTGIHVIAPTGLHHDRYYGPAHWSARITVDELAELFALDVSDGIDAYDYAGPVVRRTPYRAGVIKLAGSEGGPSDRDRRVFEAAAEAHRRTGVPILTHCEGGTGALEQIRLLADLGVDRLHVVVSHVDKIVDRGYHREILATGALAEYDQGFRWGDRPNGTLELLTWMAEDGLTDRIVLGMDAARRRYYVVYGGAPGSAGCSVPSSRRWPRPAWMPMFAVRSSSTTRPVPTPSPARSPERKGTPMDGHSITMLGTGLIGDFYTKTLHGQREPRPGPGRLLAERGARGRRSAGAGRSPSTRPTWPPRSSIRRPTSSSSGCPTSCTRRRSSWCARPARPSCARSRSGGPPTRPGGCSTPVEKAGVFAGYLEDLCYTPKSLKAVASVAAGAIGDVTWVRSRETHPGPHSAWFWDGRLTGGGAIVDLGCHCIEIIRNFVGKGNRPVEVLCHTDTLVHPIADEDNAVALIRFESGAIGQFEVSWTFRGGMDLRDEVAGTHGTIWMNHFLRTGFEMFTRRRRRRLRRGEGRDVGGLALPGRRRGQRARLCRHVQRHVRRDRRGPGAAGDVLRRLRRQRGHGRRLPLGEGARVGAGRARLARRRRRRASPRRRRRTTARS